MGPILLFKCIKCRILEVFDWDYLHEMLAYLKTVKNVTVAKFEPAFTRCRFQQMLVRIPFSKSTIFKVCRQKLCHFRVNGKPIRHIFHHFQNLPASYERNLSQILADNRLAEVVLGSFLYSSEHLKYTR